MKNLSAILLAALLLLSFAACGSGGKGDDETTTAEEITTQTPVIADGLPGGVTYVDEESAQALLAYMAKDLMEEMEANGPIALVAQGEDTINGAHAWLFALGADTPEKFTAEYHFAVTDAGEVLVMDILAGGEYVPFAAG